MRSASCSHSARWSGPPRTSSSPPTTQRTAADHPGRRRSGVRLGGVLDRRRVGVLPMTMTTAPGGVHLRRRCRGGCRCSLLGLVTAALAYVTGIAAARHLGSRLASFVALTEVAAGLAFAWILLDQQPRPIQLLGALLVLGGVVVVKLGEREVLAETTGAGEIDDLLVDVVPREHRSGL